MWKYKINSPVVEAAINDFVDKILDNFVKNLWYSITPDKEFPELIRGLIMNVVGEISVRVKEINIFGLIRDIVDLIGDHLESFRRYQAAIGKDVMKTLSSEDRDKKLRGHLMASEELYPALISKESEYKVLQKIVAGILSVFLRPGESQCPFVQTIARELLTCLVFRRLVNFASPDSISYNEDIELLEESTQGEDEIVSEANGWHSDNELDSKYVPPRVVRRLGEPENPPSEMENDLKELSDSQHADPSTSLVHNPTDMPPEGMPPNVVELILNLVDKVFQLNRGGWLRTQVFSALKKMLLFMEDPVNDWLQRKIRWLRNEDTVAHGIRLAQDQLWPNGVDQTDSSSLEQLLKAGVSKIKEFLFNKAPKALVRVCARDIHHFTQSNVSVKQLIFAILELLLRKVFPELEDLLRDIRENPPHGRSE
uniref:PXA domain-containing protein n=2 Tax=Brassica campestris TaxID=3711 RepID=M4CBD7_BRACM